MQTVLLAREIARMMRWDGDSKGAVNRHFDSINEIYRTMGYIGTLSIQDVLKSVLMATLKALRGVTKAPKEWLARHSTKNSRAPSPVIVSLLFFATFSTTMVSSL